VTPEVIRPADVQLLARYRDRLEEKMIDRYSVLIPEHHLCALRRTTEASLRAASHEQAAKAAAVLFGSFKVGNVLEDREAFAAAMIKHLEVYPAEVLAKMIRRAQREVKWQPSIAEVVAICEELIEPLRRRLRILDRMAEEHRRRQEEVRRVVERQHQDQRWIADLEDHVAVMHGEAALLPGDLALASALRPAPRCCGRVVTWREALGTPQGVILCRRLAELARTRRCTSDLNAAIAAIEEATWQDEPRPASPAPA
jgi:hypothetical protein